MATNIGLYVHIPFCQQKCIYCDFAAYQNLESYWEEYVKALQLEIEKRGRECGRLSIRTLYWGGGTPTILPIPFIQRIYDTIAHSFDVENLLEHTMEANPGEISEEYMRELLNLGVTRLSFGVQTLDEKSLVMLRRTHTPKAAYQAVELAYTVGIPNISVDFIYGLPHQNDEDIDRMIRFAREMPINHVSLYHLQVERNTYLYTLCKKDAHLLLPPDTVDGLGERLMQGVESEGFERYEISNFARKKGYGIHNASYWQYVPYLGVGAGAHSFYEGVRFANTPYVVPYIKELAQSQYPVVETNRLTEKEKIEEYCFLGLRTKWGISLRAYEEAFHESIFSRYGAAIDFLIQQGYLSLAEERLSLTRQGMDYGNFVFSHFLSD